MNEIGLGIIGLGQMGRIHLSNCLHLKNAKLVGVADVNPKRLQTARRVGVKHLFRNYEDLLNENKIDAVIISLPTFIHKEVSVESARSGKHILIEKPMARNTDEAEEIISAVEKNNVKLMVGYPLRFSRSLVKIRKSLESGELGDIQVATASNISTGPFAQMAENGQPKPVPDWWFNEESTGGGALMDLGCHMINLLRWFFGEPKKVSTHLGYRFNLDFEDHANCIVEFADTISTLSVGWFSRYQTMHVSLYGTVKHSSVMFQPPAILDYAKMIFKRKPSSFFIELEHFIECIHQDEQPSPSGKDGLEDLRFISRAYESATQT